MGWWSGEKPKVRQMEMWTPGQKMAAGGLEDYLRQALSSYGGTGGIGEQTSGLIGGILGRTDPLTQQATGLLSQYMSSGGLEPEATRSYLENVLYAPMKKTLEEQTLPGIGAAYGKGGAYFSTARAGEEAEARKNLEEQYGRISEEVAYKELMESKARQAQALQLGLQYPMAQAQLGMGYGQGIMGQIQQYLQQQPYQYVVQPGTEGGGKSVIGLIGSLLGGAVCHIVNELYGLNTVKGLVLFVTVNYRWPKTNIGSILNKLYRKFSKPISVFISKKGIINKMVRSILIKFFDYEFKKEMKNATTNLYAT